ncbi:cell division protein Fic [Pseudomonas putida]|nr:cell division protein Fic [Pseudomonas putida]AJG15654.1 cell division protein Fic [Pseudomonas plecoglossicida]
MRCAVAQRTDQLGDPRSLWERVYPRRIQRGTWHRLRRCSRLKPLPQGWRRFIDLEQDSCPRQGIARS